MARLGQAVLLTTVYAGVVIAYSHLRGEAFDYPSTAVELAVIMVPSFLVGVILGSWWVLAAPPLVILAATASFGLSSFERLDLVAFAFLITVPAMWVAVAAGVLASRHL